MDVSTFDLTKKRAVAVAYLSSNPTESPAEIKKIIEKLVGYDTGARNTINALEQAKKSISELEDRMNQIVGSITSMVELAGEQLSDEQVEDFCKKYTPPKEYNDSGVPSKNPVVKEPENDMAGTTSSVLPPPVIPKEEVK